MSFKKAIPDLGWLFLCTFPVPLVGVPPTSFFIVLPVGTDIKWGVVVGKDTNNGVEFYGKQLPDYKSGRAADAEVIPRKNHKKPAQIGVKKRKSAILNSTGKD